MEYDTQYPMEGLDMAMQRRYNPLERVTGADERPTFPRGLGTGPQSSSERLPQVIRYIIDERLVDWLAAALLDAHGGDPDDYAKTLTEALLRAGIWS